MHVYYNFIAFYLLHFFLSFFQIAHAKLLYQELNKGKFQFEHCWNVLRFQPKWLEDCQKKKPINSKHKGSSPNISSTPTSETYMELGDDNKPNSNFVDLERPHGRKAEKDRKKRKSKDLANDSSSLCLTLLQEMREEKKQFNEKKVEMFEKHMHNNKKGLPTSNKSFSWNK